MTDTSLCQWCLERLPHMAEHLPNSERTLIAQHLRTCASCQQEAALWEGIADTIATQYRDLRPTVSLDESWHALSGRLAAIPMQAAWQTERPSMAARLGMVAALVRMQGHLIRKEVWVLPALTVLVAFGLLLTPWPWQDRNNALAAISVLLGSTALAFLYNGENDAARELTLTTRMRPGAILLLRLGLVAVYLLTVNVAGIAVFTCAGFQVSADMTISWLGPLGCLAAITLLVANFASTVVALATCMCLWALRGLAGLPTLHAIPVATTYEAFWHSGPLLGLAGLAALTATLLILERRERLA